MPTGSDRPPVSLGRVAGSQSRQKLTYKDKRELEELPARIAALEQEQAILAERLSSPALYREGQFNPALLTARIEAIENELNAALVRWEALEARRS